MSILAFLSCQLWFLCESEPLNEKRVPHLFVFVFSNRKGTHPTMLHQSVLSVCGLLEGIWYGFSMISSCFYYPYYAQMLFISEPRSPYGFCHVKDIWWDDAVCRLSAQLISVNKFFFKLFSPLQPASSRRWLMLSVLHLFMFSWLGGWPKTRKRNHWSASQCLCLCLGFHRSFSLVATTASVSSPSPSLPLPHLGTSVLSMSCCLTVHLPTPSVPPVFVLQSDSWHRLSGQRGEGKPIRWEKLGLERKERLWCSASFSDFPPKSAETQTSEQALSGKRFCQMDINQHRARGGGSPACTYEPFTPLAELYDRTHNLR